MNVLITGSSGQIGTNLGVALLARGDGVVGLDKRANAWTDRLETLSVDLVDVARRDAAAAVELPFVPDVIVHLAAWAKVHQLVVEPNKALENVEMACAALELARRFKAPII